MTLKTVTKQLRAFMHGEEELFCIIEKRENGNMNDCVTVKGIISFKGTLLKLDRLGIPTESWRMHPRFNKTEETFSLSVMPLAADQRHRHLTLIHI